MSATCINRGLFKKIADPNLDFSKIGLYNPDTDTDYQRSSRWSALLGSDEGVYGSSMYSAVNGILRKAKGRIEDVENMGIKDMGRYLADIYGDDSPSGYMHRLNWGFAQAGFQRDTRFGHIVNGIQSMARPISEDLQLTRIMGPQAFGQFSSPESLVGRRFTDHGFFSTEYIPGYYGGDSGTSSSGKMKYLRSIIYAPKGTLMVPGSSMEKELVGGRGLTLSVLSAKASKHKGFDIDLEMAIEHSPLLRNAGKKWNLDSVWSEFYTDREWYQEVPGWSRSALASEIGW